jgi:UDP-N-acetylmuramoyl-L-alanyl-D-glutamate--2,6-diaminopimelate ligase
MKLNDLLKGYECELIQGSYDKEIKKIAYDSRKVENGTLFVCQKGGNFDGHQYAKEAVEKGAVAIIVENSVEIENKDVTIIKVRNSRRALSYVSNLFYGKPSEQLNIVGITGTNGKTTISFLISEILQHFKIRVGVIGTIGIQVNKQPLDLEKTTPTTPDSLELHMILKEMIKTDVTNVVMEVTSIGLEQHRVDDCKIDIGVFTNLTEDHLDFHGTMENYKRAKRRLFEMCNVGIINIDDEVGREFTESAKIPIITYGINSDAQLKAEKVKLTPTGSQFIIEVDNKEYRVSINLPGKFNVYNALAAVGTCLQLGVPMEVIVEALKIIKGAKGRFESVMSPEGYTAIVDYAHTPDALENVLLTAKEFKPNRLITVFGCGGDRDKTKRPMMGEISGKLSDLTIITSDNPRTEDPLQILKDIEQGIKQTSGKYEIIEDRKEAIEKALKIAEKGDIVIVAGKGHETYQIFKNETIHFDDMEIIKQFIER